MRHGYLTVTGAPGFPSVSILPFLKDGGFLELHCVRADPTFVALQVHRRVAFVVSESLGRPETSPVRSVRYSCEATWSTKPSDVAATLRRMVALHDGPRPDEPLEGTTFSSPQLARLATVRLRILETEATFGADATS